MKYFFTFCIFLFSISLSAQNIVSDFNELGSLAQTQIDPLSDNANNTTGFCQDNDEDCTGANEIEYYGGWLKMKIGCVNTANKDEGYRHAKVYVQYGTGAEMLILEMMMGEMNTQWSEVSDETVIESTTSGKFLGTDIHHDNNEWIHWRSRNNAYIAVDISSAWSYYNNDNDPNCVNDCEGVGYVNFLYNWDKSKADNSHELNSSNNANKLKIKVDPLKTWSAGESGISDNPEWLAEKTNQIPLWFPTLETVGWGNGPDACDPAYYEENINDFDWTVNLPISGCTSSIYFDNATCGMQPKGLLTNFNYYSFWADENGQKLPEQETTWLDGQSYTIDDLYSAPENGLYADRFCNFNESWSSSPGPSSDFSSSVPDRYFYMLTKGGASNTPHWRRLKVSLKSSTTDSLQAPTILADTTQYYTHSVIEVTSKNTSNPNEDYKYVLQRRVHNASTSWIDLSTTLNGGNGSTIAATGEYANAIFTDEDNVRFSDFTGLPGMIYDYRIKIEHNNGEEEYSNTVQQSKKDIDKVVLDTSIMTCDGFIQPFVWNPTTNYNISTNDSLQANIDVYDISAPKFNIQVYEVIGGVEEDSPSFLNANFQGDGTNNYEVTITGLDTGNYNIYIRPKLSLLLGASTDHEATTFETAAFTLAPVNPQQNLMTPNVYHSDNFIEIDWNYGTNQNVLVADQTLQIISSAGPTQNVDLNPNETSYSDYQVVGCNFYEYKLLITTCDDNQYSLDIGSETVPLDISTTFELNTPIYISSVEKEDYIEIKSFDHNNKGIIQYYDIYRKEYNALNSSKIIVAQQLDDINLFEDYSALPGILYEYQIMAINNCINSDGTYTIVKDSSEWNQGIRFPSGIIAGHVEFESGTAVQDVKISAIPNSSSIASCLNLYGSEELVLNHDNNLVDFNANEDFTIEFWLKPTMNSGTANIVSQQGSFNLKFDYTSNIVTLDNYTDTHINSDFSSSNFNLNGDGWNYFALTYQADSATLYASHNDSLIKLFEPTYVNLSNSNSELIFAKNYTGSLDEVRIWKESFPIQELEKNHNLYVDKNSNNLEVYYHFDVRAGSIIYDQSQSNYMYNKNHAKIISSNVSSLHDFSDLTDPPTNIFTYTDDQGNYLLNYVPFRVGNHLYTISPNKGTHLFSPQTRILFIDDGSTIHQSQDFIDESSFSISGKVVYDNTNECAVKDAFVMVDNEYVFNGSNIVRTDDYGRFTVEVEAGFHNISIQKEGHDIVHVNTLNNGYHPNDYLVAQGGFVKSKKTLDSLLLSDPLFLTGSFPTSDSEHNFIQDIDYDIVFIDTTYRKVIGSILGGKSMNDIPSGFQQTINNIGQVEITFESSGQCANINPITNYKKVSDTTDMYGEYEVFLKPFDQYTVTLSDPTPNSVLAVTLPEVSPLENLNFINNITEEVDTVWKETGNYSSIKTISYHHKKDIEITQPPGIRVLQGEDPFRGEPTIVVGQGDDQFSIDVAESNRVILKANHQYEMDIKLDYDFPLYKDDLLYDSVDSLIKTKTASQNIDDVYYYHVLGNGDNTAENPNITSGTLDTIVFNYEKVDFDDGKTAIVGYFNVDEGKINFNNPFLDQPTESHVISPADDVPGHYKYSFAPTNINFYESLNNPTESFSRDINIQYEHQGTETSKDIQAIVLGNQSIPGSFTTLGPAIVTNILRDPPGSNSFSTITQGTTLTYTYTNSIGANLLQEYELNASFGVDQSVGMGVQVNQESTTTNLGNLNVSTGFDIEGRHVTSYNFTQSVSTSDDPQWVGKDADIYMGRSMNVSFSPGKFLTVVPESQCDNSSSGIHCNDVIELTSTDTSDVEIYRLAVLQTMGSELAGFGTEFFYTEKHIKNTLIPALKALQLEYFEYDLPGDTIDEPIPYPLPKHQKGMYSWTENPDYTKETFFNMKHGSDSAQNFLDSNSYISSGLTNKNYYTFNPPDIWDGLIENYKNLTNQTTSDLWVETPELLIWPHLTFNVSVIEKIYNSALSNSPAEPLNDLGQPYVFTGTTFEFFNEWSNKEKVLDKLITHMAEGIFLIQFADAQSIAEYFGGWESMINTANQSTTFNTYVVDDLQDNIDNDASMELGPGSSIVSMVNENFNLLSLEAWNTLYDASTTFLSSDQPFLHFSDWIHPNSINESDLLSGVTPFVMPGPKTGLSDLVNYGTAKQCFRRDGPPFTKIKEAKYYTIADLEEGTFGSAEEVFGQSDMDVVVDFNTNDCLSGSEVMSKIGFLNNSEILNQDMVYWFQQQIDKWEEAIAYNEGLKVSAQQVTDNLEGQIGGGFDQGLSTEGNLSFDNGTTISQSRTKTKSTGRTHNLTVGVSSSTSVGFKNKVSGVKVNGNIGLTIDLNYNHSEEWMTEHELTYDFTIADPDPFNTYSISILDDSVHMNSPVFVVEGGNTSCPYEPADSTEYYLDDSGEYALLNNATYPLDQFNINVQGSIQQLEVPTNEVAVFMLKLDNLSSYNRAYQVKVESNPDAANITIAGEGTNLIIEFDAATTPDQPAVQMLPVLVSKGPVGFDFTDIVISMKSWCGAGCDFSTECDYYESKDVTIAVHFQEGCTDLHIEQPEDNWIGNTDTEDVVITNPFGNSSSVIGRNIRIKDYNLGYDNLQKIVLEKKLEGSSDFITQNIWTLDDDNIIPTEINYPFPFNDISGSIELRAKSVCETALQPDGTSTVETYSNIVSGFIDLDKPEVFGSPQPADGILSVGDEISISFNESILNNNFDKGKYTFSASLNGEPVKNNAYIQFSGTDQFANTESSPLLPNQSFTIECFIKPQFLGDKQTILSQGHDGDQGLFLGINEDDKLYASLAGHIIEAPETLSIDSWYLVHYSYDNEDKVIKLAHMQDGVADDWTSEIGNQPADDIYANSGSIYLGFNTVTNDEYYYGLIDELRIWNHSRYLEESNGSTNGLQVTLNGTETGLVGYWPMDELKGAFAKDYSRNKHMYLQGASWSVPELGRSISLSPDTLTYMQGTLPAILEDQDFTLEAWFKTDSSGTLISNGSGELSFEGVNQSNPNTWNIRLNDLGQIEVRNNNHLLQSAEGYFGEWHHLALVKNALSSTILYVDGVEVDSENSDSLTGFSGGKLQLGRRIFDSASSTLGDNDPIDGFLDELRFWETAKTQDQLVRYMHMQLPKNQLDPANPNSIPSLLLYFPFEEPNALGDLIESSENIVDTIYKFANLIGCNYSQYAPLIKMNSTSIQLSDSYVNEVASSDKIIFDFENAANPLESWRLENTTVDVTVFKSGVLDQRGNKLSSDKTWSFYIDRNQLTFNDQNLYFEKLVGDSLSFNITISNQSGVIENYSIINLPDWLTCEEPNGILTPLSTKTIKFNVDEFLFIGEHQCDISLVGNMNFEERLTITVKVEMPSPELDFDPNEYEYSMSVIGMLSVDDIISRDENDLLVAYHNQEIRGFSSLEYVQEFDQYKVFMNIYANSDNLNEINPNITDMIHFEIWDASVGMTYVKVDINGEDDLLPFVADTVIGTIYNSTLFNANHVIEQEINLSEGWNWVSFNLEPDDFSITYLLEETVEKPEIVKSQTSFAQFSSDANGFVGSLINADNLSMFKIKQPEEDTLRYRGKIVDPSEYTSQISVNAGWNWLGFISQRPLLINDAFSNFYPSVNDLIKSHESFALYVSGIGWIGTLDYIEPSKGYMLYANSASTFSYPMLGMMADYSGARIKDYQSSYWGSVEYLDYEQNMSFVITVKGDVSVDSETALGVFNNDRLVGSVKPIKIDGEWLYFLTAYGNDEAELTFRLIESDESTEWYANEQVLFEPNTLEGTFEMPMILSFDNDRLEYFNTAKARVYPNPFRHRMYLDLTLEKASNVSIEIYDGIGRLIAVPYDKWTITGHHQIKWKADKEILSGVYYLTLKVNNEPRYFKVVKQ